MTGSKTKPLTEVEISSASQGGQPTHFGLRMSGIHRSICSVFISYRIFSAYKDFDNDAVDYRSCFETFHDMVD